VGRAVVNSAFGNVVYTELEYTRRFSDRGLLQILQSSPCNNFSMFAGFTPTSFLSPQKRKWREKIFFLPFLPCVRIVEMV
jgi:hypothetical protein